MPKKDRYKAGDVAKAIRDSQGFVSKAADILGCHVSTVYTYISKYAAVKDALEATREKRHDFVENKLIAAIDAGNVTAMIFYLKTQAKSRGYIERVDVNLTWKQEIVSLVMAGELTVEEVREEFGSDLVAELFKSASAS